MRTRRPSLFGQSRAPEDGELLLGAVAGAVHQLLAVDAHRVALAEQGQGQLAAVAGERAIERSPVHQRDAPAAVTAASTK